MAKATTFCYEEEEEMNGAGSGQGSTPSNTSRLDPGAESETEEPNVRVPIREDRLNDTDVLVPTHSYVELENERK